MLNGKEVVVRDPPRRLREVRRLWHQPEHRQLPLGCQSCPEFGLCGGLRIEGPIFDCSSFCCNDPARCQLVCRGNPDYAFRVREVGGFPFDSLPHFAPLPAPDLPLVVQTIYHASRRQALITAPVVALPLSKMFDVLGRPRYRTGAALRAAYRISPKTRIVLTGTADDPDIEPWWGIGTSARVRVIKALLDSGVEFVTTPNFTLFADKPREHDLHAMKRIAITHQEFIEAGMPAALHVNARTGTDFRRWIAHIRDHAEITEIAFEFTTGTRRVERRVQYVAWLQDLAAAVDRPLGLILRGGIEIVPDLAGSFARITLFDTNAFMKATMRQEAVADLHGKLRWKPVRTDGGAALDVLLAKNIDLQSAFLTQRLAAAMEHAGRT